MTTYINTQTLAYPVSRADIESAYPNKTFAPADWPPAPFAEVHPTAVVYDGLTQDCTEGAPELVGGQWRQTWVVTDVSPEVAAQRAADAYQMTIPRAVTMRQARLALLGAGKLSAVDAAINGMAEPMKSAARIEWEYSGEVQRHNGFVSALGPALGLTSD